MYQSLKYVHMGCAVLSIGGFALRGWWMLSGHRLLRHRLTLSLPHIVDTALLGSAIAMAVMIGQYPFQADWITAKVLGLVVYVVLGTIALKRGRTPRIRALAFVAALLVFAWIVSVALSKSPAGWLAGLL